MNDAGVTGDGLANAVGTVPGARFHQTLAAVPCVGVLDSQGAGVGLYVDS